MRIGVVKEIKNHEYRVGLTPADAEAYIAHGHTVVVESSAGARVGFGDEAYARAGVTVLPGAEAVFAEADMVIKVKEPQPRECELLREDQILFTYLHLAAEHELTKRLLEKRVKAVAYETIEEHGSLPCLVPMSEIAGRLAVQEGAKYLETHFGGSGILLGGVPGVRRGRVAIVGGGVVGTNAAKIAVGMGANVTVLDVNASRLAYLDDIFGASISTLYSTDANIERSLAECDVLIGAVLIPGARAPRLVRREHLGLMRPGSVIVDVAVDQGGCIETIHPTTHDDPIYEVDHILHYGVANMPGAVALTSTLALTHSTLGYGLRIADSELEKAIADSSAIAAGVNVYAGRVTCKAVSEAHDLAFTPICELV